MKLLFDQNLSFRLCAMVRDLFPASSQVRLLGMDRAGDLEIWTYARQNDFMVVTQDADFHLLSILHGAPPKVLWLRCGNLPTVGIESLLRTNYEAIRQFGDDPLLACLEVY